MLPSDPLLVLSLSLSIVQRQRSAAADAITITVGVETVEEQHPLPLGLRPRQRGLRAGLPQRLRLQLPPRLGREGHPLLLVARPPDGDHQAKSDEAVSQEAAEVDAALAEISIVVLPEVRPLGPAGGAEPPAGSRADTR